MSEHTPSRDPTVIAPSTAALRIVHALSTLWRLGLQPGTYAEEMAVRLVERELAEVAPLDDCPPRPPREDDPGTEISNSPRWRRRGSGR